VAAETSETSAETLDGRLARIERQLDHLDGMLHDVHQFITETRPHLDKALRFLDPAASMRDYMKHRPGRRNG
jgi:ABC-type transporter Mla subunit MlaD